MASVPWRIPFSDIKDDGEEPEGPQNETGNAEYLFKLMEVIAPLLSSELATYWSDTVPQMVQYYKCES
jgi:hypothetical protein